MAKEFKEKSITINLRKAFSKPENKRAKASAQLIKEAVKKETRKTDIRISNQLNEMLWSRGMKKAFRKITVKVIPEKEIARVYLPEEKVEEKKADKKEQKKAATLKDAIAEKTAEVKKTVEEKK